MEVATQAPAVRPGSDIDDDGVLTRAAAAPLRVGILLDSTVVPAWVARIVAEIDASDHAELALVVLNRGAADRPAAPRKGRLRSHWENRRHLLYNLYCRLDRAACPTEMDAFEPVDLGERLAGVPLVEVAPLRRKYSDRFSDADVAAIRAHRLDVAIRFGFRILRGKVLDIARHGVWSHHHGDNLINRGGPPGFWEVMKQEPVTGSILQVLTEDLDNGRTICRAWSPTIDRFSVRRNRNNFYWKSTRAVPKKLKELHEEGEVALRRDPHAEQPYFHRLYTAPENREMLPLLGGMCRDYLLRKIEARRCFEQWLLAYRFRSAPDDANRSFHKYKYLVPPTDKFWADPFAVRLRDKYFIVFEEYLYATGKAHISALELRRDGSTSEPVIVLQKDYHLSYPFMFEWRGERFMVPETTRNGRIEIYRSRSEVFEWEPEGVLIDDINAADATLHEIDGRWWMFVSASMKGLHNWDELHLFHADSPMGPWKPHRRNPVKIDARNSRPAGHLFRSGGQLFRPAQDCSVRYGYATAINRIVRLTPSEFEEETVTKILPKWKPDIIGTHTYNTVDDLTVIDCLVKRRRNRPLQM